jgi:hypothetical protein
MRFIPPRKRRLPTSRSCSQKKNLKLRNRRLHTSLGLQNRSRLENSLSLPNRR